MRKLTYAEAFRAMRMVRASTMVLPDSSVGHPPHPDLPVSSITQAKLVAVTHLMAVIGRSPGDFPVDQFDKPIAFRKLGKQSLKWLEKCGIPAQRDYAPLTAKNYIWLFGSKDRLPVPENDIERFFSRLIHCLLIEVQMLITKQYFYGLGLYVEGSNLSRLDKALSDRVKTLSRTEQVELDAFNTVALDELHGKIFLEYYAVMIRAQWDKLTRLVCLVLGLRWNWDSVSDGLGAVEDAVTDRSDLNTWCREHLRTFLEIAQDRLIENGWIKEFRDPLLHDVGQHSAGVIPHQASLETTPEMWDRACDEHDWLREAMMSALVAFASIRTCTPIEPERELVSGIALVKSRVQNDG